MLVVDTLRCEYAENPLGIDVPRPRFSWRLHSKKRATFQEAYRIRVASTPELLAGDNSDLWDTGKVAARDSAQIEYAGTALRSRQRCCWSMQVWDNHGFEAIVSESAWFEMALLDPADWKASWIGYPAGWPGRALHFTAALQLKEPVVRARAYVTGLGYYEFHVNGSKLGDAVLEPAFTEYSKRVLYATFDITRNLVVGKNIVGLHVGAGWYGTPKIIAQIEVEFADGRTQTFASGWSRASGMWMVAPSPILANSVYDGEIYDARKERINWDIDREPQYRPEDRCERWMMCHYVDPPGGRLAAAAMEPIRVTDTLTPKSISQPKPGVFVFDLGQNIAGWARIRVSAEAGHRIVLRFAESLYPDGTINPENLRLARCEDTYICKGGGPEQWEPRFTYHGFRYVQVENWPGTPTVADLDGRVVRSAVAKRGDFSCDNELLNKIHRAIVATEAGNMHSIPTDCPQRDERMGWLNDLTARTEEAIHNFELPRFLSNFVADIEDSQHEDGTIPDTVPHRFGFRPADTVCIGLLLIPWFLHQHYGDTAILRRHFKAMKKWVDYLHSRSKDGILEYSYYGDWSPPTGLTEAQKALGNSANNANNPGPFTSTAFLFFHTYLLAIIALHADEFAIAHELKQRGHALEQAFNLAFWNESTGGYGTNSQSCNSLALYVGLVPDDRIARVVDNIVADVEKHDGHLTTGNICTKYLMEVLAENGRLDVAYRIATQTTYPSWGYMLENGATTIWERWEHATGGAMNSHNHPMLGSVSSWLYRHIAGMRLEKSEPWLTQFVIKPPMLEGLNAASAKLDTIHGPASIAWKRHGASLSIDVAIPPNAAARCLVPAEKSARVLVDDRPVWQNAKAAQRVSGVNDVYDPDGIVVLVIGSGEYRIEVRND